MTDLPLTPFEEYLFTDDIPAYPINCHIRGRFRGRFDHAALDAALQEVLALHPLLHSGVREVVSNDFRWFPLPEEQWPTIRWSTGMDDAFPPSRKFDLSQEPGIRFYVVEGHDDVSDLFVEFHHVVGDGIAIFAVMSDLFEAYQAQVGGPLSDSSRKKGAAERIDPSRLAHRDPKIPSLWTFYRGLPWWCWLLARFIRFIAFRPVAFLRFLYGTQSLFLPNVDDSEPTSPFPAMVADSLCREETLRLQKTATENGVSLYEWMLTAYYRSIDHWIGELGFFTKKRCLRIAVPVSLRTAQDASLSSSNVVSMMFVDRFRSELSDKQRLLRGIHRELKHLTRCKMGYLLLLVLRTVKRILGNFRWTIEKRCWASSVFTHLGKIFVKTRLPLRQGKIVLGKTEHELILDGIHLSAPLRPWYVAVLGTGIYAGSLSITFHYDATAISREHAELLLRRFKEELTGTPL